jgi:hypothetical protein
MAVNSDRSQVHHRPPGPFDLRGRYGRASRFRQPRGTAANRGAGVRAQEGRMP